MFRVLVVDDEPDIADGLHTVLRHAEHLELDVYKAYSGVEALKFLERTRIDIVLSDIRMPGISGLQLVESIRQHWPLCKVIFITGYNEFEYVYQAVKYDGISYLLKTEGYEAIIEAVGKAVLQIRNSRKKEELLRKAKLRLSSALPVLQNQYLLDLLQGEPSTVRSRQERFDELDIPLDAALPVLMVSGRIDGFGAYSSSLERTSLLHSVKYVSELNFAPSVACCMAQPARSSLLWLLQPGSGDVPAHSLERLPFFVKGCVETLQIVCNESLHCPISFVIDREPVVWEQAARRYDAMRLQHYSQIGMGMDIFLMERPDLPHDEAKRGGEATPSVLHMSKLSQRLGALKVSLESGQRDEFFDIYSDVLAFFKELRKERYAAGLEVFLSLSVMFLSYMNRWNFTDDVAAKFNFDLLTRLEEHASWEDAGVFFHQLAEFLFALQVSGGERKAVSAIQHIEQYIHEHLAEDLSLVRLGELVHFNPSYLSRLFKQITGVNVLTYIHEARVNRAKQLLSNHELKIHEISAAVGYDSPAYFTQFFKKAARMSPQEYRDSPANK